MSGGGKDTPRLDMTQFIKLADAEKIESDVMNDLLEAIQEKFEEQRKPGESFDSWLKRTPKSELKRIELSNGGSVGREIRRSYRRIRKENRCNAWREFNRIHKQN